MSDRREVSQSVNILVLDGGASGLSSLIILDEVMKRLQHHIGLSEPPNVWDYFDIVAGTGTGAVAVCMLGRLRVPLQQAIDYYQRLAEVFSDRKLIGATAFKTTRLQEVLKGIVRDVTGDENTHLMDTSIDAGSCKTMVFAMSKHNMNAGIPCIFRSYQGTANQMPDCAIWEVLCASMAHPELFKSVEIGQPPMRESFVNGGLGCTNPTAHALAEAKALYPAGYLACVVSIGAGRAHTIQIPEPSSRHGLLPANVLAVLKDIAADGERVAQELTVRFGQTLDVYFRLNVDQGMQNVKLSEWDKLGEVTTHARAYMRQEETSEKIDRVVKAVSERRDAVSMAQIDGQIQTHKVPQTSGVKLCPLPTPVFTGREDEIGRVTGCISQGDKRRCIFVLYGLGGTGKTQIALKTIERTQDMWTYIVYVDATSRETAKSSLAEFAKAIKIGETHEQAIHWLGSRRERWLMVFDNADDPKLHVQDFFPLGDYGSILVTTRIPDLVLLARGLDSDSGVSSMEPGEAMELLLKTARIQDKQLPDLEFQAATHLLEDFGHLALAVVHAGAYIWSTRCTMSQYRDMFLKQRKQTLEKYTKLLAKVDGYQRSVYTTWHMSYERLSLRAQQLLWLMAYMHHDRIGEETFRRAAINAITHEPVVPVSDTEASVHAHVKHHLQSYLDSNNSWDYGAFLDVVAELLSYSLISPDPTNAFYTLHVLVHDWATTIIPYSRAIAIEHTMFLLAVSVDRGNTAEDYIYKRALAVHINNVLEKGLQPNANNASMFAEVYHRTGRWDKQEQMDVLVLEARKRLLGDLHPFTLSGMHNLAYVYQRQGLHDRAMQFHMQVLNGRKQVLGEEHPDTLKTLYCLAMTYKNQGRYEQAEAIFLQVLDISKRVLGEKHLDTLTTLHSLASTYGAQGRYKQAETIFSQVLLTRKQVLGEQHPDTLTTMHRLASTYQSQARYEQARVLFQKVLDAKQRILGEHHPDTLTTMHYLAYNYQSQGQYEHAKTLYLQVLDTEKRVLGEHHPNTLAAAHSLAYAYQRQGQYEEAETLYLQALEVEKRVLGEEHADTISTMHFLASSYQNRGRFEQAETLIVQVFDFRKRTLGARHCKTLSIMGQLMDIYRSLGPQRQSEIEVMAAELKRLEAGAMTV